MYVPYPASFFAKGYEGQVSHPASEFARAHLEML